MYWRTPRRMKINHKEHEVTRSFFFVFFVPFVVCIF